MEVQDWQSSTRPRLPVLAEKGKGPHHEMGCYNQTPHKVAMAWLDDLFTISGAELWTVVMKPAWQFRGTEQQLEDVKARTIRPPARQEMLELLKRS